MTIQPAKKKRYSPQEIIATHLGWDMPEVTEGRYQSSVYTTPAIFVCGDDYWAAPANNKPPKNLKGNWTEVGEYHSRKVYHLLCSEALDDDEDD